MKKYRHIVILFVIMISILVSLGASHAQANQVILSPTEIAKLDKYDRNLKNNDLVLLIKKGGHLEDFIQRLDYALDQKIKNELADKINQIEQWGLNPEYTVKNLEDIVQNDLDENSSGTIIGTVEFDLLLNKMLSDGESGISDKAKTDPSIGPIYLYMCIYKDYHEKALSDDTDTLVFSDQYYSKSLEDICFDDIIQDYASTDSLSILRSFVEEMNLVSSSAWPALNGNLIETYARKWALTRNPYYLWHDSKNDCTNYVSQALYYGGLYMTYISSDQTANGVVSTPARWLYFQNNSECGYSISTSFIRVLELYNYLAPHYATFDTTNGSTMTPYLNKGFLLQGKHFIGNYSHSVVITMVSGSPKYCAHSNPRKDEAMETFYDYYYKYRVVQVY